jgi:hypothetical protein
VSQPEASRTVTNYRKMLRFRRWPVEKLQEETVAANVSKQRWSGKRQARDESEYLHEKTPKSDEHLNPMR